tara:strand:+ start:5307 stop:5777 length:471 start_codon:yes stop_codon:yes gene_type:complete
MARYNFRNATDKELAAALNSPNQDKNDAALKEQMRRFDAGEVPTSANTMDKLATQDPGPKEPIKRSAGGTAEKDTYDKSSFVNVFREEGKKLGSKLMTPRETLVELVLGKLDNPKDSKSVSKEDKKKVKKVIKRKSGGSARGTRGQTSGKNFSGIY